MSFNFVIPEINIGGSGTGEPQLQFYRRGFNLNGSSGGGPTWQDIVLSGNGSLTLTNAKQNGLTYLKLYGGCEQRNLPVGYTQYDYLRSSGTQYIDLGYKGKANTKVEIKFKYYQTSSATGSGRVFGSRTSSSSNAFAIGSSSGVVANTGNKVFWCYDGQSFYVSDNTFALDEWQTVVFSATEHTINGTTEGDDYTVTTFETPSNLMLFAFDNNGTVGVGYVDIAYCKLWDDDGTLVRDLVPAKYGTTYSMYDKVSNTFLPNAGTGDFTAGSDVVPSPSTPMDIWCNNGVVKNSPNLCNMIATNIDIGHYISSTGVYSESVSNFLYIPYIKVQPNTTYTISFSEELYYVTISEYSANDGTGFIQRNAGTTGGNTSLTITTQATTQYIRFGSNPYGNSNTVTVEQVLGINWMLAKADTAHTYIPYGITYTDGTVETVQVRSENLFNKNDYTEITAYVNANTGILTEGTIQKCAVIPCKANTTYKITGRTTSAWGAFTSSNINTTATVFSKVANGSLTTGANDKYLIGLVRTTDGTYDYRNTLNIVEVLGSATATDLYAVGTYKDVQSVLDGAVTRNVGVKVLDGTETWTIHSSGAMDITVSHLRQATNSGLCTHFESVLPSVAASNMTVGQFKLAASTDEILFKTSYNNTTDWTNYLKDQYQAGNPVIVIYPLATATTSTVTPQALTTQAGTNIVEITQSSIDNLGLEVSYKGTV